MSYFYKPVNLPLLLTKIKYKISSIKNKIKEYIRKWILRQQIIFCKGNLLIVRTDGIGDYVLFRNFIHFLKEDKIYRKYRFTLLGNIAFKSLAEEYEKEVIDEFIWIDPKIFFTNDSRKSQLLSTLKSKHFDIILNPIHSSFIQLDDFLSKVKGKILIKSKGDDVNYVQFQDYKKSEKYYDLLIDVPDTSFFEFYRNREFIKRLTNSRKKLPKLEIEIAKKTRNHFAVLIFPGASVPFRRWSPNKFANVIDSLKKDLSKPICFLISGSENEMVAAKEILNELKDKAAVIDKTGKTDLIELLRDISSADLIISNETSAVHFAAASGIPAVCISNGERFLRFSPYPTNITNNIYTVYPNEKFYQKEFMKDLNMKTRMVSDFDINSIEVNTVVSAVKNHLLKTDIFNKKDLLKIPAI